MKKYSWVFLCLFLYLICIGAGVATRNSYTDIEQRGNEFARLAKELG